MRLVFFAIPEPNLLIVTAPVGAILIKQSPFSVPVKHSTLSDGLKPSGNVNKSVASVVVPADKTPDKLTVPSRLIL